MKSVAALLGAATLAIAGVALAQQAATPPAPPAGAMGAMGGKAMTRAEADAHARQMFARMDVNKDGRLDKADREAREAERFKKLDSDGNGSLSQSEFLAGKARPEKGHDMAGMQDKPMGGVQHKGMRGHGGKGMDKPMGDMGMMMGRMADADGNGSVTEAEFLAAHTRHFDMVDANKDGTITPDERRAAMAKMRGHMKQKRGAAPEGAAHDHPAG